MSDYLAVGGVSAVLCHLLSDALTAGGPSTLLGSSPPGITAVSPDLITTGPDEQPQLNLFMYYVSLNPALRNLDLPSVNGQGARISNTPLALNLHYLVTAYGNGQFDPEVLLAWAMKVLHDNPVVPPATIQAALDALLLGSPNAAALLIGKNSTLAQQIEHLRITPEALSTEEIYRLWTAFQAPYRPSTAVQASVVVIQDTDAFSSGLPVQTRNVVVEPLQSPLIAAVTPAMATAGATLTITGSNFIGDASTQTLVSFDSNAGIAPNMLQPAAISVQLPATLQAGTRTLRVQRTVLFPGSPTPHPGFSSRAAAFQLIPTITDAAPISATLGTQLALDVSPAVGQAQQVVLYIGDEAIPLDQRPVNGPPSASQLTFDIPATLATGTFPLRIEVDGAQSALVTLGGGGFGPQVVVSP